MQHRDMLPFSITSVIENEGNEKSHFFVSVSKNATDGIFRGSYYMENPATTRTVFATCDQSGRI